MDSHKEQLAGTRVRVLILALLGSAIWIVLSMFTSSAPASAADESSDSFLGTVAGVINVVDVIEVDDIIEVPAVSTASTLVTHSVQVVLDQPPAALSTLTDAARGVMATAADYIEAELVGDNDRASDLRAAANISTPDLSTPGLNTSGLSTPGTTEIGEMGSPVAPVAPSAPRPTDATAPAQNTVNQPLAAAVLSAGPTMTLETSPTSAENDTLPTSAGFDTDCSPD